MPREDEWLPDATDLKNLAANLPPEDLRVVTQALMSRLGAVEREPVPSRLRPPLDDVRTYRVRVDLDRMSPPIWRRLELASDLRLDVVHEILQVAFGWTDSHLHRFSSGDDAHDLRAEQYLTEFDIDDGETGVAEEDVRLDQVLQDPGDRIFYAYDFGDNWQHTVRLEAVMPRADSAPRAVCTAGRRACPPEDVGGVWGYTELLLTLAAPDHNDPEAVDRLIWLGPGWDPDRFDREGVNTLLRLATGRQRMADLPADLPAPVTALLGAAHEPARRLVTELVGRARLDEPAEVDAGTAAAMVGPYTWLLGRVGPGGIALTQAGYLPPAVVAETAAELDLDDIWARGSNRESQMRPVFELRHSAQKMGLLRKARGRLLLTKRGAALKDDPVSLLSHIATRLPLASDDCEAQAGLVVLLSLAADDGTATPDVVPGNLDEVLATVLSSTGWMGADGRPFDQWMARAAARPTTSVLHQLGLLPRSRPKRPAPTPAGSDFARTALRGRTA